MMKTLLLFLVSLLSTRAFALDQAACTDVDLRDQFGPARDQGDVGWCYASVSADLLTAHYGTKDVGFMSASQIAVIFNESYQDKLTAEGGDITRALQTALRVPGPNDTYPELIKSGFCPASLEAKAMSEGPKTSLLTKLTHLNELKRDYDLGKSDPANKQKFSDLYESYRKQGSILSEIPESNFTNALEKSSQQDFLLRFADLICGQDRMYNDDKNLKVIEHSKVINVTYTPSKGPSCAKVLNFTLVPDIHREIQQNHRPVGISFLSGLIVQGGNLDTDSTGHAAIIVGRRWSAGSCQLLIRNSWGTQCNSLDKNQNIVSRYSNYVQGCESGNLWVKEADLEKSLDAITYISKGPDTSPQPIPPGNCP